MTEGIGRKSLPHQWPAGLITSQEHETYFITICCASRQVNQLAVPEVWDGIVETIQFREVRGDLISKIYLVMPDHFHGLFSFPGRSEMADVITNMKSWLAKKHGIKWQRGFFDHRLRGWESAAEKAEYIRHNPIRAGLVDDVCQWEFMRERTKD